MYVPLLHHSRRVWPASSCSSYGMASLRSACQQLCLAIVLNHASRLWSLTMSCPWLVRLSWARLAASGAEASAGLSSSSHSASGGSGKGSRYTVTVTPCSFAVLVLFGFVWPCFWHVYDC